MQKRGSTLTSAKFAQRRRQRVRLLILLAILFLALILWGIIALANARLLTIQSVEVNGNQSINSDDIQALAESQLEGTHLHFFPVNSIFWYPKYHIEAAILADWPRINSVQVGVQALLSGRPALAITVVERQPVALWCGDQELFNSQNCYYMDKNTFIFANASSSDDSLIQFYGSVLATSTLNATTTSENAFAFGLVASPIGGTYLPADDFASIMKFVSAFQNSLGLQVQKIIALGEDDFQLTLAGGSTILFRASDDPVQVTSNLQLFLKNNNLAFTAATSSAPIIDYIDLRYGTNIYYKTSALPH